MDYSVELQKIEEFLKKEYYREAGRNCGGILEAALKDIYGKVRENVPLKIIDKLIKIEQKQSKGRGGFQDFMLGQLTGLFREGSVFKYANHYLNVEYKLSKNIPLGQLTDIRNKCTHDPNYQPTLEELSFFVSHLKILISEMGYAETIKIKKQKKENILDKILRSNKKLQVIILFFGLIFSLLKGVEEVLPIFLPNQPVYQVPDQVKKENSDNQILTDLNKSYRIMVNEKPVYDSNSGLTFSLSYVQAELFSFFQLTWSSGILSNQEAIKKGSRIVIKNDDISYIINILSINKEKQSIEISIVKSETLL